MKKVQRFGGFSLVESLPWAAAGVLLCSLLTAGLQNIQETLAEESPPLSSALLKLPCSRAGQPSTPAIVYDLDGNFFQISASTQEAPVAFPEASWSLPAEDLDNLHSGARLLWNASEEQAVYLSEDDVGFAAIVVSSEGSPRVYRHVDRGWLEAE